MKKKKMSVKIPRSHTFPGGFRAKVRHVSKARLAELNGGDGGIDSLWIWEDNAGGTIYLQRGRKHFFKVKDFTHEMTHAHNEWRTWYERKAGGIG